MNERRCVMCMYWLKNKMYDKPCITCHDDPDKPAWRCQICERPAMM